MFDSLFGGGTGEAFHHRARRLPTATTSWPRIPWPDRPVPEETDVSTPTLQRFRPPAAAALLDQARRGLLDAEYALRPPDRYAVAHLAALRAAAAVLAVRARPRRRSRPTSTWALLADVVPELAEWTTFFGARSGIRVAAQAGVTRLVSARDADDLVLQAGQFLELADRVVAEA